MRTFLKVALAAAAITAMPSVASAAAVVPGFTGGTLPTVDDDFVGPVSLGTGFTANYFGTTYSSTYISTNGYITFGAGQAGYTPSGLGAGYGGLPIIAAFYADVDTRNGGTTTYGNGTFDGRQAFGVTYNNVAVFGNSTDNKRNTFQLILVNRADTGSGNFDIVLNYDNITWETGSASGGSNGLGGTSAAVGYNAGQPGNPAGTYFQFAGSLVNGALLNNGANSLIANSNVGVAGRYIFNVRNGNVTPPPSGVPEPATWAMMMLGFGAMGAALRRRQKVSARIRFA